MISSERVDSAGDLVSRSFSEEKDQGGKIAGFQLKHNTGGIMHQSTNQKLMLNRVNSARAKILKKTSSLHQSKRTHAGS